MSEHANEQMADPEMAGQQQAQQSDDGEHVPSLAEVAARRVAARTQWQKALARAKERFNPVNVREEMIDSAATTIGDAADKAGSLAWAHRGKLALAGLLGGLFFARKPIAKVSAPMAQKAKTSLDRASRAVRDRLKP